MKKVTKRYTPQERFRKVMQQGKKCTPKCKYYMQYGKVPSGVTIPPSSPFGPRCYISKEPVGYLCSYLRSEIQEYTRKMKKRDKKVQEEMREFLKEGY